VAIWSVNRIAGGFRKDEIFEVIADGNPIATLNNTRSTFELRDRPYNVAEGQLKSGDSVIASSRQKPFFNHHTVTFAGREWIFKATNFTASKFGLFEEETQIGSLSPGGYFSRLKGIQVDLPDHVPEELRLFLLSLYVGKLTEPSN
jgi:hypothetical protein